MRIICDIETNALHDYTELWIVSTKNIDTGEVVSFPRPLNNPKSLQDFFDKCDLIVGHHFIGFDQKALEHFGFKVPKEKILDTLVVSRLLKFSIEGGHSLEAWGERLGFPKTEVTDFTEWSPIMVERCEGDVEINYRLFKTLEAYTTSPDWQKAIDLEMRTAWVCREIHENGFAFDIDEARKLYDELSQKLKDLDSELIKAFPPKTRLIREITPKETKHGTISLVDFRFAGPDPDLSTYSVGAPFSRIEFEEFNPGSIPQIIERLNEAGWKPTSKTKGHILAERNKDLEKLKKFRITGWKVDEENLETLPEDAPEPARKLVQRLLIASRVSSLNEYITAYNPTTGRIHPTLMPIGAWTQRKSHNSPNCANIASTDKPYGKEIRRLWTVPKGRRLIGTDAEGIQLRVLAHYLEDKEFTFGLEQGDKEKLTDAHNVTKRALNSLTDYEICKSRDDAKTFIYAWLLGAATPKVSAILKCTLGDASKANKAILSRYPKLNFLKKRQIPLDAERGYFVGLDGRKVAWDKEHGMLAGYLQNGESIIMKAATLVWKETLDKAQVNFKLVNDVHDEWQTEVDDDDEVSLFVQKAQCEALEKVGVMLGLKCKLAGKSVDGYNWCDTH